MRGQVKIGNMRTSQAMRSAIIVIGISQSRPRQRRDIMSKNETYHYHHAGMKPKDEYHIISILVD